MRFTSAAIAALMMGTSPVLAQAPVVNSARSLSVVPQAREATPAVGSSKVAGGSSYALVLAAAVVVAGLVLVLDTDEEEPDSN